MSLSITPECLLCHFQRNLKKAQTLGDDRQAALDLKPRGGLLGLLPAPKKNWSAWWSHPA